MEEVFQKDLKPTDINHRLSFPREHLNVFSQLVEDERKEVEFQVRCGGQMYTFLCRKRKNGSLKPIIEKGWSAVVRDHDLQTGDVLKFYMEPDHNGDALFRIEVYRKVYFIDEHGTTIIRERVV